MNLAKTLLISTLILTLLFLLFSLTGLQNSVNIFDLKYQRIILSDSSKITTLEYSVFGKIQSTEKPKSKVAYFYQNSVLFHDFGSTNLSSNCPILYREKSANVTVFVITPSRIKLEQRADLTRLSQTFRLVPNLHWIVVEDANLTTRNIENLLNNSCVKFTHLAERTDKSIGRGRGATQRNRGLQWLRQKFKNVTNPIGVVYFADDDNTYDSRIFEEMRKIKKIGVWAVGLVGGSLVETPVVKKGRVTGFDTWYHRPIALDMSAFAVSLSQILKFPNAHFSKRCLPGLYENCLLDQLDIHSLKSLEPLGFSQPHGQREVLVWHTRTKSAGKRQGNKGFFV